MSGIKSNQNCGRLFVKTAKIYDSNCDNHHLDEKVSIIRGVEVKTCKGTSKLNKTEFCQMLAWVEDQTGIPLPDTEPFLKPLTHEEYRKLSEREREVYSKLTIKKIIK